MLRHKDIAEELELVALAESLKDVEEGDAGVVVVEVGESVVATEGEEVVVAFGLVTLQTARHGVVGSESSYANGVEVVRTPPMTMGLS
jgi:hypothetical protein